jgi:hypothetical protein
MNLSIAPKLPLSFIPLFAPTSLPDVLEPGWTQIRTQDEALRFLYRAADRDPRNYPVGITLSSPETGGRELSCWFETWTQLWSALRYVATHLSGKTGDELFALKQRLAQLRLSYGGDDLQVARLQRLFGSHLRVLRMGTFQDLRSGVGAYGRATVLSYLGFELPEGAEPEVPSCHLDSFIAHLRQRAFH